MTTWDWSLVSQGSPIHGSSFHIWYYFQSGLFNLFYCLCLYLSQSLCLSLCLLFYAFFTDGHLLAFDYMFVCQLVVSLFVWLVGWFYSMSTLVGWYHPEFNFFARTYMVSRNFINFNAFKWFFSMWIISTHLYGFIYSSLILIIPITNSFVQ